MIQQIKISKSLALVGAGYWGKNLARNFHTLGALHTICDTRADLQKNYKKQYPDAEVTGDFNALLKNPKIKQVAIAAPAIQHYTLTKQALMAGKDVFVEKPLCLDVEEGEELVRLAQQKGLILMVGHLLHFHPCFQHLQQLVWSGTLGKVQYLSSHRLNLGPYRTEENALWNFAPHDISMILSLCGRCLPQEVRCSGGAYLSPDIADNAMITLRFADNVRSHIYVSWLNPFKEQKLVVVGSKGMAVFDDTKPWGEKLLLYRNHVNRLEHGIPVAPIVIPEKMDPEQKEPLKEECLHFLGCCQTRTPPLTDGQEGLRVLKVLAAAQKQMDEEKLRAVFFEG